MIKVNPHLFVKQLIVSVLVVCGDPYHTQAMVQCDMSPHKQTRFDIIKCSTHSCGFTILSFIWPQYSSAGYDTASHITFKMNVIQPSYLAYITLSCDMRPHKQARSDTIKCSCSTHSCGFPIISQFRHA